MTSQPAILDIAEMALLICGTALLAAGIIVVGLRGTWGRFLRLPDAPRHWIEPLDILVALVAVLFLQGAFVQILRLCGLDAPTPPPASSPSVENLHTAANTIAYIAAQLTAGLILLLLGNARFAGGLAAWGLRVNGIIRQAGRAAAVYVALWPVCSGLLILTVTAIKLFDATYTPREHSAIRTMLEQGLPPWQYALTAANALLLSPVVEELFFRGLVQPALGRWLRSEWKAVICSGLAFGVFHLGVGYTVPALAVFGIVLGYCYAKTRSLTLVIILHMIFNGKTLLWLALSH